MALKAAKLLIRCEQCAVSSGISRPGREDDQTPPSLAKVKNESIYTRTTSYERSRRGDGKL